MPPNRRDRGVPDAPPKAPPDPSKGPTKRGVTAVSIDEKMVCHGRPMYEIEHGLWWCPDQDHDGRPASHPLGASERAPSFKERQ